VRPLPRLAQGLLDGRLGAAVERAGRLVEDQHAGIGQQGAGDADPLALAAGQLQPPLADAGLHALGQAADEGSASSAASAAASHLLRGVRLSEGDVDLQGVVEQRDVLRHQGDGRTQRRP
jgi:hypothetical protein